MLRMIWIYSETLILVSGVIWSNQKGKVVNCSQLFPSRVNLSLSEKTDSTEL